MQVAHDEDVQGKKWAREQVYTKMEVITTVYITKGAGRSYNEESISANQEVYMTGGVWL